MNLSCKKYISWASLLILLVVPYLLILQGIDFTDKGFMLSLCKQLFLFPDVYKRTAPLWLTGALGHAWLIICPLKGMLGLNILFVLLLQLNALLFYVVLKEYYSKYTLAPVLCIVSLISVTLFQTGYGYQSLTVFMLNAVALLLFKGLTSRQNKYIFLSAFLLSLSVLARLPNVFGFVFILFILPGNSGNGTRSRVMQVLIFIAGAISGFAFLVAAIFASGYQPYFIPGVKEFFSQTKDYSNATSVPAYVHFYLMDFIAVVLLGIKYLIVISVMAYTIAFIQNAFHKDYVFKKLHWLVILLAIATGVGMVSFYNANYVLKYHFKYILPGVITGISVFMLLVNRHQKRDRIILLLFAILIYGIAFAGSDTGMNPYGLFFLLFLVCAELLSFLFSETEVLGFLKTFTRAVALFVVCILAVLAFAFNYKFVYRDKNTRTELHYSIHSPLLSGLYTTRPRADAVNELLNELSTKVHAGDTIWATPSLPMLYALTGTRPFLNHVWESLLKPESQQERIAKALAASPRLPLVIRAKGTTRSNGWPEKIAQDDNPYTAKRAEVLNAFLSNHKYHLSWQNSFFEIWER